MEMDDALRYLLGLDYKEPAVIDELKETFKTEIASIRTSHLHIKSLHDLIKVLQKRLSLTDAGVDTIAEKLPRHIFNEYEKIKMGPMQVQYMRNQLQPSLIQQSANPPQTASHQNTINCHRHPQLGKVYNIICDELGSQHWKFFARELDLKENMIDDYTYCQGDIKKCIQKVLLDHEEQSNRYAWRQDLLTALDKAHRSDLRRKVESKLDEFSITYHSL